MEKISPKNLTIEKKYVKITLVVFNYRKGIDIMLKSRKPIFLLVLILLLNFNYKNIDSSNQKSKVTSQHEVSVLKTKKKKKKRYYWTWCTVTAYCPCRCCSEGWGRRTASGKIAKTGRTIAAGKCFRLGQKIQIKGHTYTVEDRGGGVKGKHIDVFVNTHAETHKWGKRRLKVKVFY